MFHVPERHRIRTGQLASDSTCGNNGAFLVRRFEKVYQVIASDGSGMEMMGKSCPWEHVSVSFANRPDRIPDWEDMCFIKDLFWDEEDRVVQFHPPKSEYVTFHPGVLHLWRYTAGEFPYPHYSLVGPLVGQTQADAERVFLSIQEA